MMQTMTATDTPAGRVRAMVDEVLDGGDLFVVDVVVRGRKGSQVVEIFIDGDATVGVDQLAAVSRDVGFLLDTEDVLPGKYQLIVSSPGIDRPLQSIRQFPKNIGRKIEVRYREGDEERVLTGELTAADEAGVTIAIKGQGAKNITHRDVVEARIQLPW